MRQASPAQPPSPAQPMPPPQKSLFEEAIGSKKGRYFGSENGGPDGAEHHKIIDSGTPSGPMPFLHALQGRPK